MKYSKIFIAILLGMCTVFSTADAKRKIVTKHNGGEDGYKTVSSDSGGLFGAATLNCVDPGQVTCRWSSAFPSSDPEMYLLGYAEEQIASGNLEGTHTVEVTAPDGTTLTVTVTWVAEDEYNATITEDQIEE